METQDAKPEIPEIKLAKVGDKRERKKGGAAWFEGTGKGAFTGATGGAGAGGVGGMGSGALSFLENVLGRQFAMMLPKILVALMIGSLGFGAFSIGRALKALGENKSAAAKPKMFASKDAPDAPTEVKVVRPSDSLGMVAGSLDGKSQAERDAEAAAAAKAAADAQAAKDKTASDAAPAAAPAAPAGMDPAAMAAAAAASAGGAGKADAAGKAKANFGSFGSSLGGGGGSGGLSPAGLAHGIAGANSLGGGLTSMKRPGAASMSNSALSRNTGFLAGRGAGFNSLVAASKLSNAASHSGVAETAATNAQNAFNGNPAGPNSVVSGAGDGTSPATGSSGSSGASGSSGGGGGAGDSGPSLGGTGSPPVGDNCGVLFPSGGYVSDAGGGCACPAGEDASSATSGCAPSTTAANATPYQNMETIGNALLEAAVVMLLIAAVLGGLAKAAVFPAATAALYAAAEFFAYAAAIMAGIVTLMGVALLAMGGSAAKDGLTFTIVGGVLTAISIVVAIACTATPPASTLAA